MAAVDTRVVGLIEVEAPMQASGGEGLSLLELLDQLMSPAKAAAAEQSRAETACNAGRIARSESGLPAASSQPACASPSVIAADLPRLTAELRVETARLRRRIQELTATS